MNLTLIQIPSREHPIVCIPSQRIFHRLRESIRPIRLLRVGGHLQLEHRQSKDKSLGLNFPH